MVIEIYYMNSKYVEFLYFIPLNVENNNLRRKLHYGVRKCRKPSMWLGKGIEFKKS